MRKFLRIDDVVARIPYSKSSIHQRVRRGLFPKPYRLGPSGKAVGWLESEIEAYIEQHTAAQGS